MAGWRWPHITLAPAELLGLLPRRSASWACPDSLDFSHNTLKQLFSYFPLITSPNPSIDQHALHLLYGGVRCCWQHPSEPRSPLYGPSVHS